MQKILRKYSPLIFSADRDDDGREAGADCTEVAREVFEQVEEEESLLVLVR